MAGQTHAEMLLGFPGIAGKPFANIDNRPALLRWMDNVETGFHAPSATDINNVDLCAHATATNDCELRIPSGAYTPLGAIITTSGTYAKSVRTGDSAAACRRYSVLLLTDGAETCTSNPNQAAFALAFPNQTCTSETCAVPSVTPDIRTYVVGLSISATDVSSLNSIAAHGGTTQAYFANDPTALSAALSDIVNSSIAFETLQWSRRRLRHQDRRRPTARPARHRAAAAGVVLRRRSAAQRGAEQPGPRASRLCGQLAADHAGARAGGVRPGQRHLFASRRRRRLRRQDRRERRQPDRVRHVPGRTRHLRRFGQRLRRQVRRGRQQRRRVLRVSDLVHQGRPVRQQRRHVRAGRVQMPERNARHLDLRRRDGPDDRGLRREGQQLQRHRRRPGDPRA